MLEGIKVLSQSTVDGRLGYIVLLWISIFLCVATIVVLIYCLKSKEFGLSIVCTIVILIQIGLIIFDAIHINSELYTEYKATIDDTVKFKEFNDRYEIKDQDGEIYTIIERDKK